MANITWVLVLLACAVALPAWLMLARGWAWRPERALHSLEAAGDIVKLVQNVQQHRGLCGAWLAGDATFAARLPERQRAIDSLLDALEASARVEAGQAYPCFRVADVRSLDAQWRQLVDGLPGCTPERSFQAHCQIVATLLDWLRALGEARIEPPAGHPARGTEVRNFSFRLPTLTECLGQARALSSAAAAGGRCAPVARVRLLFLLSRAESLLKVSLAAKSGRMLAEREEAARCVGRFLTTVRDRVLPAEGVSIAAAECFALATQAVDSVFAWQEVERRQIEAVLGGRTAAGLVSAGR